jgi:hypothetical protein
MNRFYLSDCFELHTQFFSYLAAVTITSDRTADLVLCLALIAFSSEGSFTCRKTLDSHFWILYYWQRSNHYLILNVLGLTWPVGEGLKLTTSWMQSENTTTRLPEKRIYQPIKVQRGGVNKMYQPIKVHV